MSDVAASWHGHCKTLSSTSQAPYRWVLVCDTSQASPHFSDWGICCGLSLFKTPFASILILKAQKRSRQENLTRFPEGDDQPSGRIKNYAGTHYLGFVGKKLQPQCWWSLWWLFVWLRTAGTGSKAAEEGESEILINIWGNEPEVMYDVLHRTELGFGFTQELTDQDFKKGRGRMGE